eukprot:COSAG02_NODE_33742_length_495_cov_0.972222_1_plen_43_part_10
MIGTRGDHVTASCVRRRRAARAERTKNGHSARVDAGSIGPSAL